MGTRADFYLGRGVDARWLGSTAYDGHPENHMWLLKAKTAKAFHLAVLKHIRGDGHGTLPENGWPWPWNDSHLTDHAYAFDDGVVYVTMYPVDGDGKYIGHDKRVQCAVCDQDVDQWCRLADVRATNARFVRAYNKWERLVAAYDAAKARYDVGLRKTAPTPPPPNPTDDVAFIVPRLGPTTFPDMRSRQNVTLGPRSGLLIVGVK